MSERSESDALNCSAEFCQSLPPSIKKTLTATHELNVLVKDSTMELSIWK